MWCISWWLFNNKNKQLKTSSDRQNINLVTINDNSVVINSTTRQQVAASADVQLKCYQKPHQDRCCQSSGTPWRLRSWKYKCCLQMTTWKKKLFFFFYSVLSCVTFILVYGMSVTLLLTLLLIDSLWKCLIQIILKLSSAVSGSTFSVYQVSFWLAAPKMF